MSVIITNVMAVSLDGRIGKHALESDAERREYDFTNQDDRDWVRSQLVSADAVITGANSLRASQATWCVENDRGVYPAWIILTQAGLDERLPFWTQRDVRRVLVSSLPIQPEVCNRSGVENWLLPQENLVKQLVEKLDSLNLHRVLLFGGGVVNKLFYEAGFVHFAKITLCPLIIGGLNSTPFVAPGLSHDVKMTLESSVVRGSLIFLTYKVQN